MATKSLLGRLSDRIEAIARAIDPDQAVIMVSEELEELFGPRATGSVACEDLLVARHMELFPEDRGARQVILLRTGVHREEEQSAKIGRASWELVREHRAKEQAKRALSFWDVTGA